MGTVMASEAWLIGELIEKMLDLKSNSDQVFIWIKLDINLEKFNWLIGFLITWFKFNGINIKRFFKINEKNIILVKVLYFTWIYNL